uniref:uncharacterized protein LOC122609058 n=1 Tax=Erigeron canadensis TaxID=72917 RepID=UPI001CB89CD1|nr:uncharacterized protein LOC122609058 [Erigeron canadensis]
MAIINNVSFIDQINAMTEAATIKVKIIRLWTQTYSNNPQMVASLEMILMDEQSNKIQATIKRNLISAFEMKLEEGLVKIISNFGVASNTGRFLLTGHPCKINFYRHTSVKASTDFVNDAQVFSFMSFNDILAKNVDPVYAFDVIGELIYCEDAKVLNSKKGVGKQIKTLQLRDTEGMTINGCLWDDHANELTTFLNDPSNQDTRVIMIIQNAKLGEWENKPQVSNSMFGSKIWFNVQIPEILAFKARLLNNNVELIAADRHFSSNTPASCVVVATIIKIQAKNGWYYLAYAKCSKKVECSLAEIEDIDTDVAPSATFDYGECGKITDVYPRIKLQIRVQDDTGSASFVLFQRDVTAYINKPASMLLKKKSKVDDFELYPEEFKAFVDKRCAFKIRVSDYNLKNNYRVYTVNNFTDDEGIIQAVLKNFGFEDTPTEDDGQVAILADPVAVASSKDAMSVTGDNVTPNDLLKSTASSPGDKKRVRCDTDLVIGCSSSTSRPDGSLFMVYPAGMNWVVYVAMSSRVNPMLIYLPHSVNKINLVVTSNDHWQRRQFPLVVSFAMTINKSQGQSLAKVGLFLQRPVFTHGQLYVALSRVTSKAGLRVLIVDKDGNCSNTTKNVVYKGHFGKNPMLSGQRFQKPLMLLRLRQARIRG